jgi:hypothetical protein
MTVFPSSSEVRDLRCVGRVIRNQSPIFKYCRYPQFRCQPLLPPGAVLRTGAVPYRSSPGCPASRRHAIERRLPRQASRSDVTVITDAGESSVDALGATAGQPVAAAQPSSAISLTPSGRHPQPAIAGCPSARAARMLEGAYRPARTCRSYSPSAQMTLRRRRWKRSSIAPLHRSRLGYASCIQHAGLKCAVRIRDRAPSSVGAPGCAPGGLGRHR